MSDFDLEALANAMLLLGIEAPEIRDGEVYARCPGHLQNLGREDRDPSWHMNSGGLHNCWSCGYSGNLITLVVEQLNLFTRWKTPDYQEAETWIEKNVGDLLAGLLITQPAYVSLPKPVPMTEARLAVFTAPPAWALDARLLTAEACANYGVLWQPRNAWWITPLRDALTKTLMGWQEKGERSRYFRNRPHNIKKSRTLFGLDIWAGGRMIVVESPLDAVRLESAGWTGVAVATCGAKISEQQVALMRMADDLILAFDNDGPGRQATKKVLDAGVICKVFRYGRLDAKDPGEMTDREIFNGVKEAHTSVDESGWFD